MSKHTLKKFKHCSNTVNLNDKDRTCMYRGAVSP